MDTKNKFNWHLALGALLILLSLIFYLTHYLLFRDINHIIKYLIGNIAFLFLQIFVATIVIDKLMKYREKVLIMGKLNMIIGAFYIEAGTRLLKICSAFDAESDSIAKNLSVKTDWTDKEFKQLVKRLKEEERKVDINLGDLEKMKLFLKQKRKLMVNLIQNPSLMEHDAFTDLLWAIFHLTDELAHRNNLDNLIESDAAHLAGDIKRAYDNLVIEWLDYMKHLKKSYPYLFSIALRTNPFDPDASIEVR